MALDRIALIIILLWIALYTVSFGWWAWKRKNRLGAVMIFILALVSLVLPIYTVFFREG